MHPTDVLLVYYPEPVFDASMYGTARLQGRAGEKLYDNCLGRTLDAPHPLLGEVWGRVVACAITT